MTNITCDDCGACCATMCSPPFMPEHLDGTELSKLPVEVREDYKAGMVSRAVAGWPDDEMCFWLTFGCQCKHYEHRPDICREFEPGSEGCQSWRDEFNIDVKEITGCVAQNPDP